MQLDHHPRRGAAMTEGLIVIVAITVLFGATWFFHGVHANKGATLRAARYQAWTGTRPGCAQFSAIRGADSRNVAMPITMRQGSVAITSSTAMECNVEPEPGDDMFAAVSSIMDLFHF